MQTRHLAMDSFWLPSVVPTVPPVSTAQAALKLALLQSRRLDLSHHLFRVEQCWGLDDVLRYLLVHWRCVLCLCLDAGEPEIGGRLLLD